MKWWCGHAESSVVVGALCSWFGHFPLGCTEMCEAARPEILEKHLPCSDFILFSSCTRCPALSSAGVLQIPRSALGCSASQSPAVLAAPGQPTSATSNLFFFLPLLSFSVLMESTTLWPLPSSTHLRKALSTSSTTLQVCLPSECFLKYEQSGAGFVLGG